MATTRYEGIVPNDSNDLLPFAVRENGRFSTRNVTNPTGLPAGLYLIAEWVGDAQGARGAVQFAVDILGAAWVRRSLSPPSTWTAWTPTAASGVSSFNGRTGAVVPAAGDYLASQVTNDSGVVGADVAAALNTLNAGKIDKPIPANTNDFLVYDGVNWVSTTTNNIGRVNNLRVRFIDDEDGADDTTITSRTNWFWNYSNGAVQTVLNLATSIPRVVVNTGAVQFTDTDANFNVPGTSILHLGAPNSTTLAAGTNFITCTNGAAVGAPYTGTRVFQVRSNGDTLGLSFTPWSSSDYKKDIAPLSLSSTAIRSIDGVSFRYLGEPSTAPKTAGVLYEDFLAICPQACRVDPDGSNKRVDLAGLIGALLSLVKHLEQRVSALEAR